MKKRNITIILTLIMLVSMIPAAAVPVSAATNGRTGTSSYCTVRISQSLINRRGKQYAKVKIKTYNAGGWYNTGAKVRITLRDEYGRYICSWVAKGGDTIKLGDDHSVYRIYVSYYDESVSKNFFSRVFTQGNNFTNRGGSYKWAITSHSNCTIR